MHCYTHASTSPPSCPQVLQLRPDWTAPMAAHKCASCGKKGHGALDCKKTARPGSRKRALCSASSSISIPWQAIWRYSAVRLRLSPCCSGDGLQSYTDARPHHHRLLLELLCLFAHYTGATCDSQKHLINSIARTIRVALHTSCT